MRPMSMLLVLGSIFVSAATGYAQGPGTVTYAFRNQTAIRSGSVVTYQCHGEVLENRCAAGFAPSPVPPALPSQCSFPPETRVRNCMPEDQVRPPVEYCGCFEVMEYRQIGTPSWWYAVFSDTEGNLLDRVRIYARTFEFLNACNTMERRNQSACRLGWQEEAGRALSQSDWQDFVFSDGWPHE